MLAKTETATFLDDLFDTGLLIETGVDGLYGRSGLFEAIGDGFQAMVTRYGAADEPEVVRFPPAMSRQVFEKSGYMKSFPQLAGTVHCFCGNPADHVSLLQTIEQGGDWTEGQKASEIVLTPAACYPLYPTAAKRGTLPDEGRLFDLMSYCFRHEPSQDPARQQFFRMREFVRMGTPEQVTEFRASWLERGQALIAELGLPFTVDVANDPFFGRTGKMLAVNQRDQRLKFELLIAIESEEKPTACLSFNYHQDHFGKTFGLTTEGGEVGHTACVGFGHERVILALLKHYGTNVDRWPASLRHSLGL
ncbi:amino acid--[acyl-carrier-protein] ligase [Phreatobacter cathodiphilus]|uniref:Amino acid--[acyl-carrier-protein] ligase n=1 Tax=Phreatobacter cathodiphilus TaxID=1868589 RepID=A0A2S0NA13_9HYPH|nr:amino acid--[acyl-carrier-protein] ligase [Phreatobacter cathodiphilus]AVO44847.1 amino acid--[acyl-carrier-protein] ligase [Phreatobacter cathodiphilus]